MSVLKIRNISTGEWEEIESIKGEKGNLWTSTQVGLLRAVFEHAKYDDPTAAAAAVTALFASLDAKPEWNASQINLLDQVFDYLKYTDPDGGDYADQLIASLRGGN